MKEETNKKRKEGRNKSAHQRSSAIYQDCNAFPFLIERKRERERESEKESATYRPMPAAQLAFYVIDGSILHRSISFRSA
jgi:hypothetical protein